MGATGLDFYNPAAGLVFAQGRSDEFIRETLNTGFWYPPQTMLMLTPLGHFSPHVALIGWYAVQFSFLIATAILLWRMFAQRSGALGFLAVILLVLALHGAQETIEYAQSTFIALFLTLLVWKDKLLWRAGIWASLGLIVKPYMAIWLLFLVLLRNWKALVAAAGGFLVICLTTGWLFGFSRFAQYLLRNPSSRIPPSVYSEMVNQSLLAVLLRMTHHTAEPGTLWVRLAFLGLAFLIALVGLLMALKVRRSSSDLSASILLLGTLLVYPGTLSHYSVMLAAPILVIWSMRRQFVGGVWGCSLLTAFVLVVGATQDGQYTFWLHLVFFCTLLHHATRVLRFPAPEHEPLTLSSITTRINGGTSGA
jgi:hypothetical protein